MTGPETPAAGEDGQPARPARSTRRRVLFAIVATLSLVAAGIGLWSWLAPETPPSSGARAAPPAAVRVSTVAAGSATLTQRLRIAGTIVPRDEISIGTALQDQRIASVLVDEGDVVRAGQVLARLETDALQARARQAEAAVVRARAAIAQQAALNEEAQASLQRVLPLGRSGAVSEQQVDERRAQAGSAAGALAVARAELAQAEAQRADARAQVSRSEIRAPTAGVISERGARTGALPSGPDPLFRLIRSGQLELDGEVSELDLPAVSQGQAVRVEVAGLSAPVQGRIRLVAPKVDPQTRLGRVRVSLPDHPDIRAGTYARGTVDIGETVAQVAVPRAAVTTNAQGSSTVMVVGANGRASRRTISLGRSAEGLIEIVQGLRAGERVVARASAFVREGDRVQLADRASPEAGQ